jgi:hypothetical protein
MRVPRLSREGPEPRREAVTQTAQDRIGRGHQVAGQVEQQAAQRLHVTGKAAARTTAKLPAWARRASEPSRRVLPMPASPATNSTRPAPAPASARRLSTRVRKASRPTRTGDWITPPTGTAATSP